MDLASACLSASRLSCAQRFGRNRKSVHAKLVSCAAVLSTVRVVASELSTDSAPTPAEITAALRRHFAEHNRRVLLLSLATLAGAVALWTAIYVVGQWLTLLFLTVVNGEDTALPSGFAIVYVTAAVCLLVYAWIDRRLTPNDWPRDSKPPREIVEDFLLATPRATLAVWTTLTVRQRLTESELAQAGSFLARLTEFGKLPMSVVGYDIPDVKERERVLFALQITRVIEIDLGKGESMVRLSSQRPAMLRLPDARS